ERYGVPHVVITSVSLPDAAAGPSSMAVVGSTMTRRGRRARAFKIVFPAIDAYFSGPGDMVAALMLVRMRAAVRAAGAGGCVGAAAAVPPLPRRASWVSDDAVAALDLPLARAAERVLASMHEVLSRTRAPMEAEIERRRRRRLAVAPG